MAIVGYNDPELAADLVRRNPRLRPADEKIDTPPEPPSSEGPGDEGPVYHVHAFYPSLPFRRRYQVKYLGKRWFCVVRDPLARFLSAFTNRIEYHDDLKKSDAGALQAAGLARHPDLEEFIERFEQYCRLNASLHHHIRPMSDFLGSKPARYDRIFAMSELKDIAAYCAEAGASIELPHNQSGGRKLKADALSGKALGKLMSYYAKDYAIWGNHLDG